MKAILRTPRPPRPRPGPRLFAFSPTLHVHPEGRVRFVVRISNGATADEAVSLQLLGVPAGWQATPSQTDVLVPARGHALVAVRVEAPGSARLGERLGLALVAEGGGLRATLDLEVVVDRQP